MISPAPPSRFHNVSLNLHVRGLGQSATLAINDRSRALQAAGRTVYRLGLGQSPFPVPPSVVDALRSHAHQKDYLPAKGLPALREAVADFHRRHDGLEAHPDRVIIGPGSKELMFLLQLVYYGELLVPTPCWVSYLPQAQVLGKRIQLLPAARSDGWRISADLLEQACREEGDDERPRIVILNYPGNPDGTSYGAAELEAIARVARRYRLVLLSDEIYGQLHHRGEHLSVARYYPEGTIISSGLSKWCGAGGWRLGTFSFPLDLQFLVDALAAVASETFTSVCAPVQYAAIRAYAGGVRIERYLWHCRRILAQLGQECARRLAAGGIEVCPPVGGFYLFLDFSPHAEALAARGLRDGPALCEALLEQTGVALLPGSAFGRPKAELTARLAYVDFDGAKALTASETIPLDHPLPDGFAGQWCHPVVQAVDRILSWIHP